MSPDQILNTINPKTEGNSMLLSAVIAYNYAAVIVEGKKSDFKYLSDKANAISNCITNLHSKVRSHTIEDEDELSAINHSAKIAEILSDTPQIVKAVGDTFKTLANEIRRDNPKLTLSHLEILIHARKLNKRLPKELSEYIKDILDGDVHSKGHYWEKFSELTTLEAQLRKLWIQCISLQLYKYNPDESYTIKRISEIVPSVLQSENAEVHYLFCRLMHDAEIKSVAISNYDDILNQLITQKKDKASLLLLHAALLLNKKIQANTSWINKIGTGQPIEFPSSSADSRLKPVDSKPYDLQSAIKHHPTWPKLVADFVLLQEKGMSMKEFCQKNRLSEPAFTDFYRAVMADIDNTVKQDPFLQKLSRLPVKDQNEYTALSKRRMEIMQKMCDAVSGIIGEKVEIKDMFGNGKVNKHIDRKLNEALDRFKSIDPHLSASFTLSIYELQEIESQLDTFLLQRCL